MRDGWREEVERLKAVELRLSEPQLFMQRHIEAMMYDTTKWMLETYGLFEE